MSHNKNLSAFTLVELIVVITILAILGTIGFLSLQGFSTSARDSTRISNVGGIERALNYNQLKTGKFPEPDNSINITASGGIIGFQGDAGESVFIDIEYSNDGLDPVDNTFYSYYTLENGSSMQLLTLLERGNIASNIDIVPSVQADFSNRIPKSYGSKLGIITNGDNIPAHTLTGATDIDIVQTTDSYIAHIDDTLRLQGTGNDLRYSVPRSSCQRLADLGLAGPSGNYTIYPIAEEPIDVYCRFVGEEGYTLIARAVDNEAFNNTPFGWFVSRGSIDDDSQPYSLGETIIDIPFQEIHLEVVGEGKERSTVPGLDGVTILSVTDIDLFNPVTFENPIAVNGCVGGGCVLFSSWGNFGSQESYYFSPSGANLSSISDLANLSEYSGSQRDGLNRRRYGSSFPFPGMIFVK